MEILEPIARAAAAILVIIALTRLNGLRTFSKMSGFDFVTTVAIGSVLASAITTDGRGFWIALVGLVGLYLSQAILAYLRIAIVGVKSTIDNSPLLLVDNGEFIEANMTRSQISRSDIYAKMRASNVLDFAQVRAVVLETTGDVSILAGPRETVIPPELLDGVAR